MKIKNANYFVVGLLVTLFLSVSWTVIGFTNNKLNSDKLEFKAMTVKSTFVLGEPVEVAFEVQNQGEKNEAIPSKGVESGSLKVYISNQNEDYKRYTTSGWGREFDYGTTLKPGQTYTYKASVLWNGKPDVSHLNEDAAKRILKGKITTEYAFPEPGTYFIKGVSYFGGNSTPNESEPIKIVINEPNGDDLEVWNQIKGNKEIALLMQSGEFNTTKETEKISLVNQVEQIVEQHPNSIYSNYLKPNLEKFRAMEAKREEFYKNMKQKPE